METEYIFAETCSGFESAKLLCDYLSAQAVAETMAFRAKVLLDDPRLRELLKNPPAAYPAEIKDALLESRWGEAAKLIREGIYADVRQLKIEAGPD